MSRIKCTCKGTHYVVEKSRAYFLARAGDGVICLYQCPEEGVDSIDWYGVEEVVYNVENPPDDRYVTIIAQLLEMEV